MSEVGDAVQVVMLCGRGAMLIGNISLKMAMQITKLMNTIYLAKWEGSVSLNRLRQIKGDDFVFINVSSEKKEDLAAIEKEMKSHGILFARMPDLCGGDARTQYAIASSDAIKMKAMLLDHTIGPNSHIRVGPISEADYMMTGKKADGTDTKEMEELKKSAQETVDAAVKKEKSMTGVKPDTEKEMPMSTKRQPDRQRKKGREKSREGAGLLAGRPEKEQKPSERQVLQQAEKQIRDAASDVRIRVRDAVATKGEDSVYWISQKPVYENRQFAQFMLPDGIHAIFVRQADILPFRDAANGKRMAALFRDQSYSMMNMQKVNVTAADGTKAIAMFKLPGGAVVAHSNQQPDRKRDGLERSALSTKNEPQKDAVKAIEKGKQL